MNEFVILEGDQQELWEIDYEKKIAINISDINIVETKMTRYDGTIKDYLTEKGFTEVHFHENVPKNNAEIMTLNKITGFNTI